MPTKERKIKSTMTTEKTRTFSVKIAYTSSELTVEDKIRLKDTREAQSLESISRDGAVKIGIVAYAVLDIHNEKSDDKDYTQYVFMDKDGNKYMTGSEPFFNSFTDIWEELDDAEIPVEDRYFKIYQLPSRNFVGRNFVTCSLAK